MATSDSKLLASLGVTATTAEEVEQAALRESGETLENGPLSSSAEAVNGVNLVQQLQTIQLELSTVGDIYEAKKKQKESEGLEDGANEARDSELELAVVKQRLKSLLAQERVIKSEIAEAKILASADNPCITLIAEGDDSGKGDSSSRKELPREDNNPEELTLPSKSTGLIETDRDRLIRTGVITPFDSLTGFDQSLAAGNAAESDEHKQRSATVRGRPTEKRRTTILLEGDDVPAQGQGQSGRRFALVEVGGRLRQIAGRGQAIKRKRAISSQGNTKSSRVAVRASHPATSPDPSEGGSTASESNSDSDYEPSQDEPQAPKPPRRAGRASSSGQGASDSDFVLSGGLRVPAALYSKLFPYQQTGVKWLWELHCQGVGGILADEMGLGKTVQVIAYLAALHHSGKYRPSLLLCPATLLQQWRREVRRWYPLLKVSVLHSSSSSSSAGQDSDADTAEEGEEGSSAGAGRKGRAREVVQAVLRSGSGLLITTYDRVRLSAEVFVGAVWGAVVLDEGHRIRNPDSALSLVCKQLQAGWHRLLLTGAPIQNSLGELWSLLDFVFPGKLGTLPTFKAEFALPIALGGYAGASAVQAATAYRCAVVLRDMVLPYLLRRQKADVAAQLPQKTERVLFCSLTPEQRQLYRSFVESQEVEDILAGGRHALYGIDILRKICNHPDLVLAPDGPSNSLRAAPERSGKLLVLAQVLAQWHAQGGQQVLLFSQGQQMLAVLEAVVRRAGYAYLRMDGSTPVGQRTALMDRFNSDPSVFAFLLTTRVGGLGTNLTAANKVVIFDPDWNPSNDLQARERAWRIGQRRAVTVYRLVTRGTIEEKVYLRQLHKLMLTDKILKDPRQKRLFRAGDLRDLFSLQGLDPQGTAQTETAALLAQGQEQDQQQGSQNETEGDAGLLQSLLGVHSSVDHSCVEALQGPEREMVESEAERVAEGARAALRSSRQAVAQVSGGRAVPTWTGRSGVAGAPPEFLRRMRGMMEGREAQREGAPVAGMMREGSALSARDLLAKIRSRDTAP